MLSEETRLMNLVVALQIKNHGVHPSPLFDSGFILEAIEQKFAVTDSSGNAREVRPEGFGTSSVGELSGARGGF